jgi:hypothetical protein
LDVRTPPSPSGSHKMFCPESDEIFAPESVEKLRHDDALSIGLYRPWVLDIIHTDLTGDDGSPRPLPRNLRYVTLIETYNGVNADEHCSSATRLVLICHPLTRLPYCGKVPYPERGHPCVDVRTHLSSFSS